MEKTAAPAFEPAPEPFVVEPPIETPVESYSTAAFEPPAAAHVEAPHEPAAKRKGQKGSEKPAHGIRSVLGLTQDENDGPASLLAAVAALEAEEQVQVEPMVAPVVDAPGFDAPIVAAAHTRSTSRSSPRRQSTAPTARLAGRSRSAADCLLDADPHHAVPGARRRLDADLFAACRQARGRTAA